MSSENRPDEELVRAGDVRRDVSAKLEPPHRRLMVDPSLLFSETALAWLQEDPTAQDGIIVPAVFMEWLRGERSLLPSSVIAGEDLEVFDQRRERLLSVLSDVPTFSYHEVRLEDEADAVLRDLFASAREPRDLTELRADEWAFLQSQSFLVSKLRHPLEAFRDAGSVILEVGRWAEKYLIGEVIPPSMSRLFSRRSSGHGSGRSGSSSVGRNLFNPGSDS
jgi:hypothetical protein